MKKNGIINGELAKQIAGAGHQDLFLVCNAAMAVPAGIPVVDLALVKGVPAVETVLKAILEEMDIEYVFLPEELKEHQPETYGTIKELLSDAKEEANAFIGFKSFIKNVKFIVRTGDMTPYANVILRAGNNL